MVSYKSRRLSAKIDADKAIKAKDKVGQTIKLESVDRFDKNAP